jgi:hypothetical protein
MTRKHYKASIIAVCFDEDYKYEDILLLGISSSPMETFAIQQQEIARLYEYYGVEDELKEKPPIEYSEGRSAYDEPICVIKYASGYEHIYCLFEEDKEEDIYE